MAGPILNIKIFTKSPSHSLRAICLATFPPGFLLLFVQGIASGRVNPAIGILPFFVSSAFSAFLLANEKKCGCQASGLTGTPVHIVFDLLIGIGLLVCLILTWVFLPRSGNEGMIMLGTYCTNFLIINFLIHLYFTIHQLYDSIMPGANYPTACPQCQYGPFTMSSERGVRKGYAPLLDRQGQPSNQNEEEMVNGEEAHIVRGEDAV
ncbi:hypothetical protein K469DRAFT_617671 [Zopfia rhizophila CBS 207.26]|uniref:MARVEL domain-containing protein n=1 Tax=Zopfia rhizophila CBS 207.26 TaxID=1314779 RepID=A0A6A6ET19_9PEZI|nr:hypothetical protein K469DRAFT_617671 [Zopfia rhizophila CBS 207.26]